MNVASKKRNRERSIIFSFNHSSFFVSLKFTFRNREPWESVERRVRRNERRDRNGIIARVSFRVFHVSSAGTSVVKKPCNFARTRHVSFLPRAPPFLRFDRSTSEPGKEKSLCEPFAGGRREGGVNLPRRKSVLRGDVAGDFNELTFHWAGRSTKRSTRGKSASMAVKRVARMKGEGRFEKEKNFSASS